VTDLSSHRILIAGAVGGVGRRIARSVAGAGAHALLLGRDARRLDALRVEIEAGGGRASVAVADATDAEQVDDAVAALRTAAGGLDTLVNAVGVNVRNRRLADLDEATWRSVLDANLTSAFLLTQAVLPGLRAQADGLIVHIASTGAKAADLSGAAYQASKAGLAALARATAIEAGGDGVRVSTIYPGLIDTDFVRFRPVPPSPDELERALAAEDVAAMCLAIIGLPPRAQVSEVVMTPARL
jgi:NADP-dependent 3-hydroxy acid dehydrogenase YdfG